MSRVRPNTSTNRLALIIISVNYPICTLRFGHIFHYNIKPLIMKQLIFALVTILLFSTCQKEVAIKQKPQDYIEYIQSQLRASLSDSVYQHLDFDRSLLSKSKTYEQHFLRVPFKGEKLADAFVILKTNKEGLI